MQAFRAGIAFLMRGFLATGAWPISASCCYPCEMITWLKKLVSRSKAPTRARQDPVNLPKEALSETVQVATVWAVVDRYLRNNPSPTAYGVHALVAAGAGSFLEPADLIQACDRIKEHGYRNPLNPTLVHEMDPTEILEFVRWHGQYKIQQDCYDSEPGIRELIQRFRASRRAG